MKTTLKNSQRFTAISTLAVIVMLFATIGCEKLETPQIPETPDVPQMPETPQMPEILDVAGTWNVKAINLSGELTDIASVPDNASYSSISIEIPDTKQGYIEGNTFYNKIEFEFERNEGQQIYIHKDRQYIENELLIHLNSGVDAAEFAANSEQGIVPKRNISQSLNIWLFETDGTTPLRSIVSNLSQHPDVTTVSYNNAGATIREVEVNHFIENMRNTVKFEFSNNELNFMDSRNNIVIVFITPPLNEN